MSRAQVSLFDKEVGSHRLPTNIKNNQSELIIPEGLHTIPCTHGIHRFAGKFIPNIPRYILRTYLSGGNHPVIFDPFCGSGTSLVEAALEGKQFVGMDIDPLAVAISTVKTNVINEDDIQYLENYWRRHNYKQGNVNLYPCVPNLLHWFSEEALVELSSIKAACLNLPEHLRLFNLVVFSSIIRRVSNADDQTQKTYVSHTLPKSPPLPSRIHPLFLQRAFEGMREFRSLLHTEPRGTVICGDAGNKIRDIDFSDIITSPPYIDSIDYVYNNMLEYFWMLDELGIHSYDRYREFRKKPMGFRITERSVLDTFASNYLPESNKIFESICSYISEKSSKEALAVKSFFYDYSQHLSIIRKKQKEGNYYICVIGNSYIRGTTVPTVDFITDIHQSLGYDLIDKLGYEIKRHYMKFPRRHNSRKIKEDFILIFRVAK